MVSEGSMELAGIRPHKFLSVFCEGKNARGMILRLKKKKNSDAPKYGSFHWRKNPNPPVVRPPT